jgi:glycosyltransferase involved in cell wall biosynthesis
VNLLYVTTNFRALTLTFVAREVSLLRARGHRVELLALRPDAPYTADSVECDTSGCLHLLPASFPRVVAGVVRCLIRRPRRLSRAVSAALRSPGDSPGTRLKMLYQIAATTTILARVEKLDVSHIHAHLASPPGNYAWFLSMLTGIPFSFTGHAADLFCRPEALRAKFADATGVVGISAYNLAFFRSLAPALEHAEVIHCGVDTSRYPYRQRNAVATPPRILAVGRAAPKKGFTHLLRALRLLSDRGVAWRADLVGGGPLLEALRAEAEALGLDALNIRGARQQAEIRELLAAADVFVLPCVQAPDGDIDGIPVALMEAMACGVPVVSTRLSGIPELIEDGRSGLLVPPADPQALADALARLVSEPGLQGRLSREGREKVEREFDLPAIGAQLERFFTTIGAASR